MKPEEYSRWLKLSDIPTVMETERLIIRLLDEPDAPELFACIENSRTFLSRYVRWAATHFMTETDTLAEIRRIRARFFSRDDLHYATFEKSTGRMIGSVGQHCEMERTPTWEIGYSLFEPYIGKGYATEAARAMVQMSFDTLLTKRVVLVLDSSNQPSRRVAERLGFTYELTMREHTWNTERTALVDLEFHSLIAPEYEARTVDFQVLI